MTGVLEFAERYGEPGVYIMDTPGHDIEQMVGMVAGGCQVVAFTAGRGTPTGSPIAPCLKITTSSAIFERMDGDIDLDAGTIVSGEESLAGVGERIYEHLLATASGKRRRRRAGGTSRFAERVIGKAGSGPGGGD